MKTHLHCPDCGSSDALADYGESTYCFSCKKYTRITIDTDSSSVYNSTKEGRKDISFYPFSFKSDMIDRGNSPIRGVLSNIAKETVLDIIDYRGVSYDTYKTYGCSFVLDKHTSKPIQLRYPYGKTATKVRNLLQKGFHSEGNMAEATLFGKELFAPGGLTITLCEGEQDALSAYQMMGSKYPAVSVRSSAQARKDCEKEFTYLNSFQKIYLCFDSDEQGQKALREVASLFDPNKVYHVKLNRYKDANDYLVNEQSKAFMSEWWNARPYLPKGIISDYKSIEEVLDRADDVAIGTFPFGTLNEMTYGIFSKKFYLIKAPEKVGKTEVFRAIEYHLLKTTEHNIGIIHLEEGEKRSIQGLVGYDLKVPVHFPDSGVSKEDVLKTYKDLTKKEGRCFFYSHFGSDDPQVILDTIRYLVVACHCKFIFLDHITMLVTGYESDDERKKLDYISTRLAMLTRELDFCLFLISHVNDNGDTRGSRNISKVADLILSISRNIKADDYDERHKTKVLVEGNRDFGLSGPAGTLWFDAKTFTLSEMTDEIETTRVSPQTTVKKAPESPDYRADSLWAAPAQQETGSIVGAIDP